MVRYYPLTEDGETIGTVVCEDCKGDGDHIEEGRYSDGESDTPVHCDECGLFLENALTPYGYEYVVEAIEHALVRGHLDSVAVREWRPYYGQWIPNALQDRFRTADEALEELI